MFMYELMIKKNILVYCTDGCHDPGDRFNGLYTYTIENIKMLFLMLIILINYLQHNSYNTILNVKMCNTI